MTIRFKNISSICLRWTAVFILLFAFHYSAYAQNAVPEKEKGRVAAAIGRNATDWNSVSLSGKLKMDMLPLNPSMKIFMIRDSVIRLSLRVPLMGEIGRAEIDKDSLLVVNKMKKTFVKEGIGKLLAYYPGSFSDLQEALLGRVVIPGYGILSENNSRIVEMFLQDDGGYSVIPNADIQVDGFNYGYIVDSLFRASALAVVPVSGPESVLTIQYAYNNSGYDINVAFENQKRKFAGSLDLDKPDWSSSGFAPIQINSKFRRMDFRQFLKSF